MAVFLVPIEKGRPIVLDKAIVLIGRQADCDVVITRSRRVSRRHCCVAQVNDRYIVRDLGSMNGVRVNGKRIDLEANLNFGDVVSIGDVGYILQSREVASPERENRRQELEELRQQAEQPRPLIKQPLDLSQIQPVPIPPGYEPVDPDGHESFGNAEELDSAALRSSGNGAESLAKVQSADFLEPPLEQPEAARLSSIDFAALPIPQRPMAPPPVPMMDDDLDDEGDGRRSHEGLSSHYELLPD